MVKPSTTIQTRLRQSGVGFYKNISPEANIIARLNVKERVEENNSKLLVKAVNKQLNRLNELTSSIRSGRTMTKEEINLEIQDIDNAFTYLDRQLQIIAAIDEKSPLYKILSEKILVLNEAKEKLLDEIEKNVIDTPSMSRDIKAYFKRKARTKLFNLQMSTISPFQDIVQSDSLLGVMSRSLLKRQSGRTKASRALIKLFGVGRDIGGVKEAGGIFKALKGSKDADRFASGVMNSIPSTPRNIGSNDANYAADVREQQMQQEEQVKEITNTLDNNNTTVITRLDEILDILHGKKKAKGLLAASNAGGSNNSGLLGGAAEIAASIWGPKWLKKIPGVGKLIGKGEGLVSKIPGIGKLFSLGGEAASTGTKAATSLVGIGGEAASSLSGIGAATKEAAEVGSKLTALKVAGKFSGFVSFLSRVPGGTMLAKVVGGGAELIGKFAWPLTVALSLYDGVMGWNDVEDIANIAKGDEASTWQKVKASTASVLSGLSFGIFDKKSVYSSISTGMDRMINAFGGSDKLSLDEKIAVKEKEIESLRNSPYDKSDKISKSERELQKLKNLKTVQESGVGGQVAEFESGSGGPGTISSGAGDVGGKSYGTYQLASKTGTLEDFIKSPEAANYKEMLTKATVASTDFDDVWKQIASSDPSGFQKAQHDFISRTHFMPAIQHAAELGFDTDNSAIKEMIWSGSVQHGKINKILDNTAKMIDLEKSAPAEQIKAFYEARSQYTDSLGNVNYAAGRGRYQKEAAKVLAYNESNANQIATSRPQPSGTVVATTAEVKPSALPAAINATPTEKSGSKQPTTPPVIVAGNQQPSGPSVVPVTSIQSPTTEFIRQGAGMPS